jgi:hypothetical protein
MYLPETRLRYPENDALQDLKISLADQEISHKKEISRMTDTLDAISSGMHALLGQDPEAKQESMDRLLQVSKSTGNGTYANEVHEPYQVEGNVGIDELFCSKRIQ